MANLVARYWRRVEGDYENTMFKEEKREEEKDENGNGKGGKRGEQRRGDKTIKWTVMVMVMAIGGRNKIR